MRNTTIEPAGLTNEELLAHVKHLARRDRDHLVELLQHLGELDARQAFLADGAPSLFRWCTGVLRLSEAAAFTRIRAARVGRRFPLVLERLRSGDIHVHALSRLAPHLTIANHRQLLDEARHAPRSAIDRIVARFQEPVRPSSRVVALGVAGVDREEGFALLAELDLFGATQSETVSVPEGSTTESRGVSREAPVEPPSDDIEAHPGGTGTPPAPPDPPWRLHLTLGPSAYHDLERLQELMRHQVPDGDPAAIVARALVLLREQVEKRRLGRTQTVNRQTRRRTSTNVTSTTVASPRVGREHPATRHIPAAVRREVAARDEERCAFVTSDGRRCGEQSWLEFHHLVPHARGGRAIPGNLELRCRAHNRYEAERDFDGFVREEAAEYGGRPGPPRRTGGPALRQRGGVGLGLGFGVVPDGAASTGRAPLRRYGSPSG